MANTNFSVNGFKSFTAENGNITADQLNKLIFNNLAKIGLICSLKQVELIKKAVMSAINESIDYGNLIDTVSKTTYMHKKVKTRIYADLLQKDGGLETLVLLHPEVIYNKRNLVPEDEIKYKGKRDTKDPDIFITTDGEKISISKKEAEIEKKYFSNQSKEFGSSEEFSDELLKKAIYNAFAAAPATETAPAKTEKKETATAEATEEEKPAAPKKIVKKIVKTEQPKVIEEDDAENEEEAEEALSLSALLDDDDE